MSRRDKIVFSLLLAGLCIAPFMVYPVFMAKLLCFSLFAMAFSFLVGQTGLLSFGHAMFFGGAGYLTGYLLKNMGWSTEAAIVAGAAFGAFSGLILGMLSVRRHGVYFGMITLALAQMFYYYCVSSNHTGGDDGLSGVPRRALFGAIDIGDDRTLYFVVLAVVSLAFLMVYRILRSPFGQVLRCIRDNEERAVSLGYHVQRYKLLAFVLSATLAGLAGSLKVIVFQIVTLVDVSWSTSGDVILMALVGGLGTVLGPIVGATFLLTLQSMLQGAAQWMPVVQGAFFVIIVLALPRGIIGELEHRINKR